MKAELLLSRKYAALFGGFVVVSMGWLVCVFCLFVVWGCVCFDGLSWVLVVAGWDLWCVGIFFPKDVGRFLRLKFQCFRCSMREV